MLAQFMSRYPTGSLISELLQIHEGRFVVRVAAQVNNVTLATGLAAADTIEQAEDRARERALSVLMPGVSPSIYAQSPQSQSTQKEISSRFELPLSTTNGTNFVPSNNLEHPGLQETAADTYKEPSLPLEDEPLFKTDGYSDQNTPAKDEIEEGIESPLMAEKVKEPVDLSDVIAQTTIELKRLGWNNRKGRDYLVKTYGKQTRQELTDEELLEFLAYLKSQPTPI